MKKCLLLILIQLTFLISGRGQIIDNKFSVYLGYQMGNFHGNPMIQEGDFTAPSLFANYKELSGFSMKLLVKLKKNYSAGVALSYVSGSGWNLPSMDDYLNSATKQYAISPFVEFHTSYKPSGLSSRLKGFIDVGPNLGISNLTLSKGLYSIQNQNGSAVTPPLTATDGYLGLKAKAGLELSVNQSSGFFVAYSFEYNRISSTLFNDEYFSNTQLELGFFLRYQINKHYYY